MTLRSQNLRKSCLYVKLYADNAAEDELLAKVFLPILEKGRKANQFEYCFFIRYADPKRHLRLRLFGNVGQIRDEVRKKLLPELASRHRLLLVTKGDPAEQNKKLVRSGLAPHFSAIEVLPEKYETAYRFLADHHGCDAATTWMIGNSPKSDINPALAAGLHAIFIPHDFTWVLEHETVNQPPPNQTLLELPNFHELLHYF